MIKKIFVLLIASLFLITSACSNPTISNTDDSTVVDPEGNVESKEITILVYDNLYRKIKLFNQLERYSKDFYEELGIKVNLERFGDRSILQKIDGYVPLNLMWKDFYEELDKQLSVSDEPELILINTIYPIDPLIEKDALMEVSDKVSNIESIYYGLVSNEMYYIPIGMYYSPFAFNNQVLQKQNISIPSFNWTREDYLKIRDKWLENNPVYFSYYEKRDVIYEEIASLNVIDNKNNIVTLNTPDFINTLHNIKKEIFSGKYILNEGYTYENFHNMFYEPSSNEHKEHNIQATSEGYYNNHLRTICQCNALKASEVSESMENNDYILLPKIRNNVAISLGTWGFVVNQNGKNKNLALDFINGLLADDTQLEMFNDENSYYYPVNSSIETEIIATEESNLDSSAIELKKYLLSRLKIEKTDHLATFSHVAEERILSAISDYVFKFVFSEEPFSDEEIQSDLNKLETECNTYLNKENYHNFWN